MKKIDITVTEVDVPSDNPFVHFVVHPRMGATMLREGEYTDQAYITAQRLTYERRRVIHELGRAERRQEEFLVKVDDRRLFDALLKISDDDVNRLVREKSEDWVSEHSGSLIRSTRAETLRYVSELPWWKRLFSKF